MQTAVSTESGSRTESLGTEILLRTHIPNVEGYVLPGATHFPHLHNTNDLAEALSGFIDKHPL